MTILNIWAINSEGECLLDVEKVIGSNPILPTKSQGYATMGVSFSNQIYGDIAQLVARYVRNV